MAKLSRLQAAAYVAIILCAVAYLGQGAVEFWKVATGTTGSGLEMSAFTNVEAAHVTLTNLKSVRQRACLQGKVTAKGGETVTSTIVCSGEMQPMTTVSLVAPYPVGKVMGLCSNKDRLGIDSVDWSRCDFEIADRSSAVK